MKSFQDIKSIQEVMDHLRGDIDKYYKECHEEPCKLAASIGVPVSTPQTCNHQRNRANVPNNTPEQYFWVTVTAPFLDHLKQELCSQFFQGQDTVIGGRYLVPSMILENEDWKEHALKFLAIITDDFPSPLSLNAELLLWEHQWGRKEQHTTKCTCVPSTVSEAIKKMDQVLYPNIHRALHILGTVPVTICECERSVSSLRRLKTYLRSTMTEGRLTGLALMHSHYNINVDTERFVKNFAVQHPKHMEMVNMLPDWT